MARFCSPGAAVSPGSRAAWAFTLVLALAAGGCAGAAPLYQRETAKSLAEVLEDAEFAITERNFRITGSLHIGQGIRERGSAAFPDYEVILFCNLEYAREMLELEPAFINYCPGRITVRQAGGRMIVSAPMLPESTGNIRLDGLMRRVNSLVREIIDYSVETWAPGVKAD